MRKPISQCRRASKTLWRGGGGEITVTVVVPTNVGSDGSSDLKEPLEQPRATQIWTPITIAVGVALEAPILVGVVVAVVRPCNDDDDDGDEKKKEKLLWRRLSEHPRVSLFAASIAVKDQCAFF